jgi:predicted TPR repeat methyltransferase
VPLFKTAFIFIETSTFLFMPTSSSAKLFKTKIEGIHLADLGLKAYPEAYGKHILDHLDYYVSIYGQVIEQAIKAAGKHPSLLTVLDFGCGNGFLGMFARQYGFKNVWLCDVAPDFLEAAEKTAAAAGIAISGFIQGDFDVVQNYFKTRAIKPDIVLSTDVIEHIYDLQHLFRAMQQLNPEMISVFTTASNPFNVRKVKALQKAQQKDEWEGYAELPKEVLNQKGFSALSFFEQRKNIIRKAFRELPDETVVELARCTRGKMVDDIIRNVNVYCSTGAMPDPPRDPHWVCDPYTGSWTERVLPISTYREIAAPAGFSLTWTNGFYNASAKGFAKSFLIGGVNAFISRVGALGKFIAPFIVLVFVPAETATSKSGQ